jgi:hypothetical protein
MEIWLFFNRVAFICNICFALVVAHRMHAFIPNVAVLSSLVILGYLGALLCNAFCGIGFVIWKSFYNKTHKIVPNWLLAVNFILLLTQLIYFL